ncbi:MAG: DNA mismatch repair endonuclease MutL [Aeromonadaceae bacterium]|jgi:DNA mismatch repair protein MutL|nr:DNA mismatch repair endonuclease MutL [Aeromonadaceae bacterium]
MPIRILPPILANQIAAGEVVERPASVVKELVENSLDAGASRIEIELEKGGCKLIRIRDNGSGIPQVDLALALARHATSKVSSLDDLEAICSLGFRGEALASISSVSRLTLTSRTAEQTEAWQATAEGRDMAVQVRPAAHPVGTTLEVVDLFFNTPARRKFLRSEKTEYGHIDELIRRLALSRFDVTFILKHNGKVVRQYRSAIHDEERLRRIASACGSTFLTDAIQVRSEHLGLTLQGWLLPPARRTDTSPEIQYCYVNGRVMRDKLINHGIRQGYLEALGLECSPSYVLYLTLDPHQVDVNVHPAKHEVRFHESRLVHDFVVGVVRDGLQQGFVVGQTRDGLDPHFVSAVPPATRDDAAASTLRELPVGDYAAAILRPREHGYQTSAPKAPSRAAADGYQALMTPLALPATSTHGAEVSPSGEHSRALSFVHPQILLWQQGGELRLLHVAHAERLLLVGRLKKQLQTGLIAQPLLMPVSLVLEPELRARLDDSADWIQRLGLEWRAGHGRSVTVLRVPAVLRQSNLVTTLVTLLEMLGELDEDPEAQEQLCQWLASLAPSRQDGSLSAAMQLLVEIEDECPELLCLPELARRLSLEPVIEELVRHE